MSSRLPAALSVCVFALCVLPTPVRAEPGELVDLRARFNAQIQIEGVPLDTLNRNFVSAMERLLKEESQSGNLDQVLAVKEEIERFAGGRNFSEAAYRNGLSSDRKIRNFQEKYLLSRQKIESDARVSQWRLHKIYLQQPGVLEASLTKALKINEALPVKEEGRKIEARLETLKDPDASSIERRR